MPPLPSAKSQPKSITILGSTGSIGKSAAKLLGLHRDRFRIEALTANGNAEGLAKQAIELKARRAVIGDASRYMELKSALSGTGIEAMAGPEAIVEAARLPSDIVLAGVVGAAGLMPTLAAIQRGATVALANKECLVCAGSLMMEEVKRRGATLIPVDSEHSAIFQVFDFTRPEAVDKIILTASGGPFRNFTREQMRSVTPEQAVRHPNWSMGAKISVDSATMMNKGLEIIEAFYLFPVTESQIEVLIHPESIIHSMVSYIDGSVLAQMGAPDMVTPIAYALAWPERIQSPSAKLDFKTLKTLTFDTPDEERFPALKLARAALRAGGSAPIVLNAANEVAVARFLRHEITFHDIIRVIEETLTRIPNSTLHSIENVVEIDRQSRTTAESIQ
jgi:1-deoxy-D-xylulose-5-phosphate reductoisomerase